MLANAARRMKRRRAGIVRAMLLLVRGYNAAKNLCLTAPLWPVKHDKDMEPCEDMNNKSKPAFSLVTPQARHHYTRLDQIDRLIGAGEVDSEIGYMGRLLALCCLPRTNPGNRLQYKRVNGPYKLIIIAGGDNKLPFGHIPRLLLGWVCTEAVRTQSRDLLLGACRELAPSKQESTTYEPSLVCKLLILSCRLLIPDRLLGKTLSDFMRVVGIDPAGASFARVRNQMKRLFRCQISLIYTDGRGDSCVSSIIADRSEFWWPNGAPMIQNYGTAQSGWAKNFSTKSSRILSRST